MGRNRKQISRMAMGFLVLLLCAWCFVMSASAATKQGNLFYNDSTKSMIIRISYEVDDVTIRFIDPDGNEIDPLDEESGCTTFVGETSMLVVIPDAMEGQWLLSYDKGSNGAIDVQVGEYEEPIWITEFTLDGVSGNELQVTFQADFEEELTYQYILYLTTENTGEPAGRELASGSAAVNEACSVRADLSNVNTYDNYYLLLYVYYMKDGLEYFDYAYTDAFSYTNPDTPEGLEDVNIEIDLSTNMITFDWTEEMNGSVEGVYLFVDADGTQVDEFYVSRDDDTTASLAVDDGVSQVTVAISALYSDGRVSEELVKTVSLIPSEDEGEFALTFPESGTVNTLTLAYDYSNADAQAVQITLNDEEETVELDGSGTGYLTLQDGANEIEYSWYSEENRVTRSGIVYILVDRVAPSLELYEDYDGSQTQNDSVVITGKTDTDAILTIAGDVVTLEENGTFLWEVSLENGENVIEIVSQDEVGNAASFTILVTRSAQSDSGETSASGGALSGIFPYLPLIFSFIGAILLILLLFLAMFVKKKYAEWGMLRCMRIFSVYFAVLSGVGAVSGLAAWIAHGIYIRSEEFIDYALESSAEAYEYLQVTKLYRNAGLICLAVFAVMLLLSVLATKFRRRTEEEKAEIAEKKQKKREKRRAKKQKAKEKKARNQERKNQKTREREAKEQQVTEPETEKQQITEPEDKNSR